MECAEIKYNRLGLSFIVRFITKKSCFRSRFRHWDWSQVRLIESFYGYRFFFLPSQWSGDQSSLIYKTWWSYLDQSLRRAESWSSSLAVLFSLLSKAQHDRLNLGWTLSWKRLLVLDNLKGLPIDLSWIESLFHTLKDFAKLLKFLRSQISHSFPVGLFLRKRCWGGRRKIDNDKVALGNVTLHGHIAAEAGKRFMKLKTKVISILRTLAFLGLSGRHCLFLMINNRPFFLGNPMLSLDSNLRI